MRKLISIRIDAQIHQTARKLGLNISRTCENCLKQEIQRPIGSNPKTNCILTCDSTSQQQRMAGGAGFEPATPSLGGSCPILARLPALVF
jgi:hypothetical protein